MPAAEGPMKSLLIAALLCVCSCRQNFCRWELEIGQEPAAPKGSITAMVAVKAGEKVAIESMRDFSQQRFLAIIPKGTDNFFVIVVALPAMSNQSFCGRVRLYSDVSGRREEVAIVRRVFRTAGELGMMCGLVPAGISEEGFVARLLWGG